MSEEKGIYTVEANLKAWQDVIVERKRQEQKWGEQNHNPYVYLAILVEEVGELAQAILHTQFGGSHSGLSEVRKEAVHCAAVAVAIIECLDRNLWLWKKYPENRQ